MQSFCAAESFKPGHTLRILETTDNRCMIEGIRKESGDPHRASFTADQARRAGIDLGKYPADKLIARATSRLCRQAFPDVLSGSLIAEDLIDGLIPTDPADVEAAPAAIPAPVQRTRKPRAAKAASTQPKPAPTTKEPDPDVAELLDGEFGDEAEIRLAAAEAAADYTPDLAGSHAPTPGANLHDSNREEAPSDPASQTFDDDVVDLTPEQLNTLTPLTFDDEIEVRLITPKQLTKLSIALEQAGFHDSPSARAFVAEIIGHTIGSRKDLTFDEASRVIDILENDRPNE